jgi:hypothetical protein
VIPWVGLRKQSRISCENFSEVVPLNDKSLHCTVRVRNDHDIPTSYHLNMVYQAMPIRPDKTNSIVVKILEHVLCSSCGGVPFNAISKVYRQDTVHYQYGSSEPGGDLS